MATKYARRMVTGSIALVGLAVLAEAGPDDLWDLSDAREAVKIEIQVAEDGSMREVEFHVAPESIPAPVRGAMDRLHPGGPYTDAERERSGGELYYELSRVVDGREVEAMFTADGTLHSEEIEVEKAAVPEAVASAIAKAFPEGTVSQWEEIHDGERALVEYHVKLGSGGRSYKVRVSPAGAIEGAVLEVVAELEVPVELP
jgi:hypothetical protein